MADNLLDLSEETENGEEAVEPRSDSSEIFDFPQTLVTEKIIFVIDILLLEKEFEDDASIQIVLEMYKSYLNLKKKICIKPPEFECLLYNNSEILQSHINSAKDLQAALASIKNLEYNEESHPLQIDKVFDKIAELVELPDPDCSKKGLPPNWVYHVIWLFGQNLHVPLMENPNSFDFLMMTPYFALDMLYWYNDEVKDNQCEQISQALQHLNENGKGYFLATKFCSRTEELFSCFAQFLGHPLIRVPQSYARFNIHELGQESESYNSDREKQLT